jgi:phosphoenolpyruvate carboxykinase (ATP)
LDDDKNIEFSNDSITQNTRVSYPLSHIDNVQPSSVGHNPKNIFFLTADAFGVLPPISKLTPGQAAFHFISGYTAKVAGTEEGIDEPLPSFSACFGAPFMPLHPTRYAEMLSKKMKEANVNVWLINTGWSGGPYGVGSRIKLRYTRAMITAALEGKLDDQEFKREPFFGLYLPESCPDVPDEVLFPKQTWKDPSAYDEKADELAGSFHENFEKFSDYGNDEIMEGSPDVGK